MTEKWTLHTGDCLEVMRTLAPDSVDAIVTDPPYGLEFMGKDWDAPWKHGFSSPGYGDAERLARPSFTSSRNPICTDCGKRQRTWKDGPAVCSCVSPKWDRKQADEMRAFQVWCEEWTTEALRVAKPGAHILAFGGTRTHHRLMCALEDAGWEIRDTLMWMYGSGFPKSKNLDGDWVGYGTALKPAFEPIVLARKPLIGTVAANVQRHGVGGLNIDGCRIGFQSESDKASAKPQGAYTSHGAGSLAGPGAAQDATRSGFVTEQSSLGRWPANVILDEEAGALLDAQTGNLAPGASPAKKGLGSARVFGDQPRAGVQKDREQLDGGGASRFFYCAKTSKSERNAGVDGTNDHPTVKPIALMRYLVRLVTPPNGLVLDPFNGSGTTGCASVLEGFRYMGIEQNPEYVAIAEKRIAHWETQKELPAKKQAKPKAEKKVAVQPDANGLDLPDL